MPIDPKVERRYADSALQQWQLANGLPVTETTEQRQEYGGDAWAADQDRKRYLDAAAKAANAPGVTVNTNPANIANQGQLGAGAAQMGVGGAQLGLAQAMHRRALGLDPSVAEQQLRMGLGQTLAQQSALANSARGGAGNQAYAQRMAQNNAGNAAIQTNANAALLRAKETSDAYAGLGAALSGAGQTFGGAGNTFGQSRMGSIQQQNTLANVQSGNMDRNNAMQQYWNNQYMDVNKQDANNALGIGNQDNASSQISEQAREADQKRKDMQTQQAIAAIGMGLGLVSDERLKEDIKPAKGIGEMLAALKPSTYRYKDEQHGDGERVGIMAQDLEKSEVGKLLVRETPIGKAVDGKQSLGALLAAAAEHEKRLRKLEGGR